MLQHRNRYPVPRTGRALCALAAAAALYALLALLVPIDASASPTVTVRVQGLNETLLPQTTSTTNTTPIPVGKATCEGTTAGGALYDATEGHWVVKEAALGIELLGLEGLDFPEFSENPGIFWAFWLNGKPASNGVCGQPVANGDRIVMFPQCYEKGPHCASATAPDHFLTLGAPEPASADVGQPVQIKVGSDSTASETGAAEPSLPEGTSLSAGPLSVAPGAGGVATISFPAPGVYVLQAHAPDSVPSDAISLCVHNGNDGTCGTSVPVPPPVCPLTASTATAGCPPCPLGAASTAILCRPPLPPVDTTLAGGARQGRTYHRHNSPRVLSGIVQVPAGATLREVRISLQRRVGRRCWVFSGKRERFVRSRCGHASFFSVGGSESFSYLLPSRLPRGRYVYEVQALEASGRASALVPGASEVSFRVT